MGMRAQVKIEDTGVYLYTHWGSNELSFVLQKVLDSGIGRARGQDPEYLARIIFDAMKTGDYINEETGFGIGTSAHTDLEYPPIIVNCKNQTVISALGLQSFDEFIHSEIKDDFYASV